MQIEASLGFSFISMVDQERKWCHFSFKSVYGSNRNNGRKCLILFVTIADRGKTFKSS